MWLYFISKCSLNVFRANRSLLAKDSVDKLTASQRKVMMPGHQEVLLRNERASETILQCGQRPDSVTLVYAGTVCRHRSHLAAAA